MKKLVSLILAIAMVVSVFAISAVAEETDTTEASPLDALEFTLPDGITLRQYSDSQETFVKGSVEAGDDAAEVGGVFLLDYDGESSEDEASTNTLEPLLSLVLSAMQDEKGFEAEWYMGGSSLYGPIEVSMGNDQAEYAAYVVQAADAYCVVWFDEQQISSDDKISIMQSIIDPGFSDYPLPEGYSLTNITSTTCSLVKDGQVVGSFAITDLDVESLEDWRDWDEENVLPPKLIQYLEEDMPDTIYDEYMIEGWSSAYVTVIFVLNNTETDERQEYLHYFFERDGQVWDFWIDREVEDDILPSELGIGTAEIA